MAENNTRHNSFHKCMTLKFSICFIFNKFNLARSPTSSFLLQHQNSSSPPNSPVNKGHNSSSSLSRGRQLWNMAVEGVLESEKTPPLSMVSSMATNNDPNGWYNLTKR
jgi:hypothetical protein